MIGLHVGIVVEGVNDLIVWANDTVGLYSLTGHEHTFFVDTIPPTLNVSSPINNATYTSSSQLLNIQTDGTTVIYNVNGGLNQTYTSPVFITLNEGINQVNIWSYDLAGNSAYSTIYFTLNTPIILPPAYQSNGIYQVMNSSGAGLGIFIKLLAQALPMLLIGLAFVGILIGVGFAIATVIKKFNMK